MSKRQEPTIPKTLNIAYIGDLDSFRDVNAASNLSNIELIHVDVNNYNRAKLDGYHFAGVLVDKYATSMNADFKSIYHHVLSRIKS